MLAKNENGFEFPWGHNRRFNDYSTHIKRQFGGRVQKISVNVGFSCPNRDGSKGTGGCIYCDNNSFKPDYCRPTETITQQIESGKAFFAKKYPDMRYIAYFQSYTNTYAPIDELEVLYREALSCENVVGLIIGTRPDCVTENLMELFAKLNLEIPVTIEFGIESTRNETLTEINRCHTWEDTLSAILLCQKYNIKTGGHLILGLPGEDRVTMLEHATRLSALPLETLKLHQLQVIRNTPLAKRVEQNPDYVHLFSLDEYIQLAVDFLELLNPAIVVERFVSVSPDDKLIAPKWNRLKNFEVVALIDKELQHRNSWQGKYYTASRI